MVHTDTEAAVDELKKGHKVKLFQQPDTQLSYYCDSIEPLKVFFDRDHIKEEAKARFDGSAPKDPPDVKYPTYPLFKKLVKKRKSLSDFW